MFLCSSHPGPGEEKPRTPGHQPREGNAEPQSCNLEPVQVNKHVIFLTSSIKNHFYYNYLPL